MQQSETLNKILPFWIKILTTKPKFEFDKKFQLPSLMKKTFFLPSMV